MAVVFGVPFSAGFGVFPVYLVSDWFRSSMILCCGSSADVAFVLAFVFLDFFARSVSRVLCSSVLVAAAMDVRILGLGYSVILILACMKTITLTLVTPFFCFGGGVGKGRGIVIFLKFRLWGAALGPIWV